MDDKLSICCRSWFSASWRSCLRGGSRKTCLSRDKGTPGMQDIAERIFQGRDGLSCSRQYRPSPCLRSWSPSSWASSSRFSRMTTRRRAASSPRSPSSSAPRFPASPGSSACTSRCAPTSAPPSAARKSLGEALTVALRGGAVSGFLVVALGLLGVISVFWVVYLFAKARAPPVAETPFWIVGFAFGASLRRPLRPTRRRHLHQSGRRRRGPGRQGRSRHPGRRSAQSGRHRGPGRRQRRRLRRPRRGYLRIVGGGSHRRHDPRRRALHGLRARTEQRSSPGSSSRSCSAAFGAICLDDRRLSVRPGGHASKTRWAS